MDLVDEGVGLAGEEEVPVGEEVDLAGEGVDLGGAEVGLGGEEVGLGGEEVDLVDERVDLVGAEVDLVGAEVGPSSVASEKELRDAWVQEWLEKLERWKMYRSSICGARDLQRYSWSVPDRNSSDLEQR